MYIVIEILYFRTLKTEDFKQRIKGRLLEQRSKEYVPSLSLLILQEGKKVWGEKRTKNMVDMQAHRPEINTGLILAEINPVWRSTCLRSAGLAMG